TLSSRACSLQDKSATWCECPVRVDALSHYVAPVKSIINVTLTCRTIQTQVTHCMSQDSSSGISLRPGSSYSKYVAVVVSVSQIVQSFTRTRPFVISASCSFV